MKRLLGSALPGLSGPTPPRSPLAVIGSPLRAAALGMCSPAAPRWRRRGPRRCGSNRGPSRAAPGTRRTQLVVRAVAADAPGRDIPGAICDAVSPYFASRFAAPARLLIPEYGSQTPAVTATCEGGGASGRATVAPQASYSGGGFGGPAVGISVGTGGGGGTAGTGTGSAWG